MTKCNLCINTHYSRVESLEDISDDLRYIGKDGKYNVYFGKYDDIYFVEEEDGKMDGNK